MLKAAPAIDRKFFYSKEFVRQNVIYPQCGRNGREGSAEPGTLCQESILQVSTNGAVSIGNGYIIEISYYNERMPAPLYLVPYNVSLF